MYTFHLSFTMDAEFLEFALARANENFRLLNSSNVSKQVIEYLNKKGYSKTEAMLRMESSNQESEGRTPNPPANAEREKYTNAFGKRKILSRVPGNRLNFSSQQSFIPGSRII